MCDVTAAAVCKRRWWTESSYAGSRLHKAFVPDFLTLIP